MFHPFCWPRWVRRSCLIVPPFALAAWLGLLLYIVIARALAGGVRFVRRFWSASPRRRIPYGGYPYGRARRRRGRAKAEPHAAAD